MAAEHWIWLSEVLSKPSRSIKPLIDKFGSAENFFDYCKGNNDIKAPITKRELERVHKISADDIYHILQRCGELGIEIIPYTSPRYPERLKSISNPPAVLYAKGKEIDIDGECSVTVVGPRVASDYGLKASFSLARRLAASGVLIVSGGAVGVDGMAHRGAVSVGSPTVAILGCGINYDYPKGNAALRDKISQNGILFSEYPPDFPPSKSTYPARNRLLSAISCGTVVIEAGITSGALITAGYAAEQGRDVFVIPGNPSLPQYEGSNKLLKDGAKPVLTAADVLEEYYPLFTQKIDLEAAANIKNGSRDYSEALLEINGADKKSQDIKTKTPPKEIVKQVDFDLPSDAKAVYESIKTPEFTVDDAVVSSKLSPSAVLSALTELEIFGLITSLPGGRYKIS